MGEERLPRRVVEIVELRGSLVHLVREEGVQPGLLFSRPRRGTRLRREGRRLTFWQAVAG